MTDASTERTELCLAEASTMAASLDRMGLFLVVDLISNFKKRKGPKRALFLLYHFKSHMLSIVILPDTFHVPFF